MNEAKRTITLELTEREAQILQIICCLDIDVPRIVASNSHSFSQERIEEGARSVEQTDEIARLLYKISGEICYVERKH